MIGAVLGLLLRLWMAACWIAVALLGVTIVAICWPFVREVPLLPRRREEPLLPFGCGCCGQDCPDGDGWCLPCRAHVGTTGPIEERTYWAQHGVDCPYARPPIEETRLMPGAEQRDTGDENDQKCIAAEGLGIPGDPVIKRAWPSQVHAHAPLDASSMRALAELEREAHS